jgi:hypothetical protein
MGEKEAAPAWRFWRGEVLPCAAVYFFFALTHVRLKVRAAPDWLNGQLAYEHGRYLAFTGSNNMQSRVLEWLIPEGLVRLFGLDVPHAYMLQRFVFVWVALVLFHVYLRRWFTPGLAFGGACLLAACLPFTYIHDLQESAPQLMVSFLACLWAIRAGRPVLFSVALTIGALTSETVLVLPTVYFFDRLRGWKLRELWAAGWRSVAVAAPAFALLAPIRYLSRNNEHIGGGWHLPDNLKGLYHDLFERSPFTYHETHGLYSGVLFIYGALWLYAYLGWRRKPHFVRAGLLMVPFFLGCHMLTGIIAEMRQLIPLAYVVIPGAFFWLFPGEASAAGGDIDSITAATRARASG